MKRREFIALLGGAVVSSSALAQQVRTIGLLGSGNEAAQREWTAAFVKRIAELGWTEGSNLKIAYRWADGRNERFAEIAAEFTRLNVDLILTHNTCRHWPRSRRHQASRLCLLRLAIPFGRAL